MPPWLERQTPIPGGPASGPAAGVQPMPRQGGSRGSVPVRAFHGPKPLRLRPGTWGPGSLGVGSCHTPSCPSPSYATSVRTEVGPIVRPSKEDRRTMISPGAWLIIQPGQKLQEALYASGGAAENRVGKGQSARVAGTPGY